MGNEASNLNENKIESQISKISSVSTSEGGDRGRQSKGDFTEKKAKDSPSHSVKSRSPSSYSVKNEGKLNFTIEVDDDSDVAPKRPSLDSIKSKSLSGWDAIAATKRNRIPSTSHLSTASPKSKVDSPSISPNHRPRISFSNREIVALQQSPSKENAQTPSRKPSPVHEKSLSSKKFLDSIQDSMDPIRKALLSSKSPQSINDEKAPKKSLSATHTPTRSSKPDQSGGSLTFGTQKSSSPKNSSSKSVAENVASKIFFDQSDSITDDSDVIEVFQENVTRKNPVTAAALLKFTSPTSKRPIAVQSDSPIYNPKNIAVESAQSKDVLKKRIASSPSASPNKRSKTVSFKDRSSVVANGIEYENEADLDSSLASQNSWEQLIDSVMTVFVLNGVTTVFTKWKNGSFVYIPLEKAKTKFPVKMLDFLESKICYEQEAASDIIRDRL